MLALLVLQAARARVAAAFGKWRWAAGEAAAAARTQRDHALLEQQVGSVLFCLGGVATG
jgi:hypothetical protein